MLKTSSLAIAAALAVLAAPAIAQDQNSSTTGQTIKPPAAVTTDGTAQTGDTAQTTPAAPAGDPAAVAPSDTAQTTPATGTDAAPKADTAVTTPTTTPNAGVAQSAPAAGDMNATGTADMNTATGATATMPNTDTAATVTTTTEPFITMQSQDQFLGSNLMGAKVVSAANENIGDVNDVLFDMQGKAQAVVVGVGGFLGIGEKNVAVPFNRLTVNRPDANDTDIQISLDTTKDELNNAPEFKKWDGNPAAAATTTGVTPNATGSTATGTMNDTGMGAATPGTDTNAQ